MLFKPDPNGNLADAADGATGLASRARRRIVSIFVTLSPVLFKEFGFGLGAAILLDATLVRAVLLPATMKLFGDWTHVCRCGSSIQNARWDLWCCRARSRTHSRLHLRHNLKFPRPSA